MFDSMPGEGSGPAPRQGPAQPMLQKVTQQCFQRPVFSELCLGAEFSLPEAKFSFPEAKFRFPDAQFSFPDATFSFPEAKFSLQEATFRS